MYTVSLVAHVEPHYIWTSPRAGARVFIEPREPLALLFGGGEVWRQRYPAASFSYISYSLVPRFHSWLVTWALVPRSLLTPTFDLYYVSPLAAQAPARALYKEVRGNAPLPRHTRFSCFSLLFHCFLVSFLCTFCTSYAPLCALSSLRLRTSVHRLIIILLPLYTVYEYRTSYTYTARQGITRLLCVNYAIWSFKQNNFKIFKF